MDFKKVLQDNNFTFKKQFGQNFITDANLLLAIVKDSGVTEADTVVEVGAGAGTLTAKLAECAKRVIAFEIDEKLRPVLQTTLEKQPNVEVHFEDILKVKPTWLKDIAGEFRVVANLPYYITTPVIMYFFEGDFDVKSVTVMVQEEVARRLTASPGGKDYGAITVMTSLASDVTITRKVNRTVFVPQPNVDSAIVRFDMKSKYQQINVAQVRRLVKSAFGCRRKTLANNLSKDFGITKEQCAEILTSMSKKADVRGETLSVDEFVKLNSLLHAYMTE
ncbi:MAG: 16S rRNA (adenine(1518)-N(6)/adenine(1519)-N(6))-dimethyltransferase RsmA [Clostridia bacterium]|nr:16S rRNA (adenine(1518)-N(6)/adenine(1519)-N(6))-dimethyltransferase RsmA [Clostridia bacterium]